jgi:hypothetical protein
VSMMPLILELNVYITAPGAKRPRTCARGEFIQSGVEFVGCQIAKKFQRESLFAIHSYSYSSTFC